MTYKVVASNRFKKDLKLAIKRGYDISLLDIVINEIANGKTLAASYLDHALKGKYSGYRECHISPDWLLIYTAKDDELVLYLARTGSHSDLF